MYTYKLSIKLDTCLSNELCYEFIYSNISSEDSFLLPQLLRSHVKDGCLALGWLVAFLLSFFNFQLSNSLQKFRSCTQDSVEYDVSLEIQNCLCYSINITVLDWMLSDTGI